MSSFIFLRTQFNIISHSAVMDNSKINAYRLGSIVKGGALAALVSAGVGIVVTVTISRPAYNWIGNPIAKRIANRWGYDETNVARLVTVAIIGASGGAASGATSGAIGEILKIVALFKLYNWAGILVTRDVTAGIWRIAKHGVIFGGITGLVIGLAIGYKSAEHSNNNYVVQVAVRHGNVIAGVVSAILTAIMVSYTVVWCTFYIPYSMIFDLIGFETTQ